ncbi:MAG: histidine phosphatase family protein [Hyphomicrobiales bacterium]
MTERPPLYFVRHGETEWNRTRRIQGRTDIPLNAAGIAQAAAVGQRLAQLVDPSEFDFYASPLGRARETMTAILAALGLPETHARYDERLVERSFGAYDGQTWPELFAAGIDPGRDPAGFHDWRPEGGENYADVTARVGAWLDDVRRPAVVVSHGGVSRALRGLVLGLAKEEIVHLDVPQRRFYRIAGREVSWFDLQLERT